MTIFQLSLTYIYNIQTLVPFPRKGSFGIHEKNAAYEYRVVSRNN